MIFVGGCPFAIPSSSSEHKGNEVLVALLEHPLIVAAANLFKSMPERKFSVPEGIDSENSLQTSHVYVFQREYATVDPSRVKLAGTDEATTCVGVIIRNQKSGMTSVAHMDSPELVDMGLTQMLSSMTVNMDDQLDVHLIGGFEDTPSVVDTVETSSGLIRPANFDRTTRCPDEIARRVRLTLSSSDPAWRGKLLETYDTYNDRFLIAPCSWSPSWRYYAAFQQKWSDSEILQNCSTSPLAEDPDFVENQRRVFDYLMKHPDWRETFPPGRDRIFERTTDGQWKLCL